MSGPRPPSGREPDEGPLIDTGPSEIEIERRQAGVDEDDDKGTVVPPETEMPPD